MPSVEICTGHVTSTEVSCEAGRFWAASLTTPSRPRSRRFQELCRCRCLSPWAPDLSVKTGGNGGDLNTPGEHWDIQNS